ncbi:ATP-binding protein [Pontixanthobacter aestiaquae]|uniref:histidine kinase n=1 Tax=Pontixanthobacter aestiaquae TaxID=1509367 RepID=A0A844Z9S8_9SPHN|nr:ATP-binding protein [Pontixanthobacter aestiaquae]MDN3645389.1 ATP-binding protein [Pontixanthobacter aestiaquae]MXO83610.1 HAMP domain-containing protein [Pontixanthobacter aestiaquae]
MDGSALTIPRKSPRLWRRFVVASRRANFFLVLEIAAVLAFVTMAIATYFAFSNAPPDGRLLPSGQVATLLIGTLLPAMGLLVLFGRRMAIRRAEGSTARLHTRLVFFFSMVAAVPTLLVAAFAAVLFQSGVDFWFSDNSRGLMQNANELAQGYYEQNQVQVRDHTVTMADDLRAYLSASNISDDDFVDWYNFQMQGRELNETAILQRVPDGTFRTAIVINLDEDNLPADYAGSVSSRLDQGEAVVVSADAERIEALTAIDEDSGIYLYNARNSEDSRFQQWERAKSISTAYDTLTSRARALQLRFNLALFFVSLALVGLAVWFALRFADRQVEPLTDLVAAARKVGAGNFALRVEGRTGADEIGMLNRAFNRMTSQIEKQTADLVGANEQLDQRRGFMETLLESTSAGIISTDKDGRILLMNSTAQDVLLTDGHSDRSGSQLRDMAPEISDLVEAKLSSGIISYNRDGELLTLAVKLTETAGAMVITFEDITRQLLDQRRAAWSDVARRIAHEIKNPLTPIQLATERLKRRYRRQIESDGELFDDLTNTIVRQVAQLRTMVDEFSSFARLPKPVFRVEDALDLVRQSLFLQEVAHPGVDFNITSTAQSPVSMACDRHQIGQAMTNILKNAVEAVEAKAAASEPDFRGKITVELAADEDNVTVEVQDNGVGLPKDRDRIVEPYMTTRDKGTGLGLAIVNKIIEEHGGEINFASTESGGTKVTVRFARDPLVDDGQDDLSGDSE